MGGLKNLRNENLHNIFHGFLPTKNYDGGRGSKWPKIDLRSLRITPFHNFEQNLIFLSNVRYVAESDCIRAILHGIIIGNSVQGSSKSRSGIS